MADPQIRAIVRSLGRLAERVVTKITLDVTANLVEGTPVDVGWARANWIPSIGVPFSANLSGMTPTPLDVAAANQERGVATARVLGYKLGLGKVFVTNNVPYVPRLNDGSSKQAPAGFVQRAIAKAIKFDIRGLSS